jgi:hypothetical protein
MGKFELIFVKNVSQTFLHMPKNIQRDSTFFVYVGPCRVLDQIGKKFKHFQVFGNFYHIDDFDAWFILPLENVS